MRAFAVCFFGLFAFVCSDTQPEPPPSPEPIAETPVVECEHALFGCPSGAPETNDFIVREIYTLSSNDETKFSDWVAYRLDASMVDGPTVSRNWKADPLIASAETLEPADYTGARAALDTDRGHQAPLASFRGTPHAKDTNFLSNITPQDQDLNQGPWRILEEAVRDLARTQTCYVVTGPLYERDMPPLPEADETHKVPSGYWKIVAVGEPGKPASVKAVGFFFDQTTPRSDDFKTHTKAIDEIEQKSGLDFFVGLPDGVEDTLESAVGNWPLQ